jgi:hypothetical protein
MAIGIISALKAVEGNARPDDNSVVPPIDRLASLPQVLIMQMAQKGQIPKSMVAPVLAKKAENAQLGVQMQAAMQRAQTGGVPPSTVVEKVIAQNAAQEAAPAMNRSNVGVASAPMRSDMFEGPKAAGGGIVAFQGGGGTFIGNLADRLFGSTLDQYGKSIDRTGALKRKQMYERMYGPDAVNFSEYNEALKELGMDPRSDLGGGILPELIPDVGDDIPYDQAEAYKRGLEANRRDDPVPTPLEEIVVEPKPEPKVVETKTEEAPPEPTIREDAGLDNKVAADAPSNIVDDTLKDIQDARKPKSSSYDEFAKKASKLSGEDLAMLGLEFGLNLMGTKEQDFLTGVGQAGKPALKTALAKQAERRKEARESKMLEQKFKNERALVQDQIESREKIAGLDRSSREKLAAYRLKEVIERLNLSEKNMNKKLVQSFLLNQRKDFKIMALETELLAETDSKKREDLRKQILELSAIRLRNDSELLGIDLDAVSTGGSGGREKYPGFSGSLIQKGS